PGAAVDRKTYTSWMIRTLIGYGTNGWDAGWLVDPPTPHFTDVPRTYADGQSTTQADAVPYYQYIETAREYGLVGGYDDGTFRPSATLTRAQAMKILVEGMDWPHPDPSQARFHDVPVTYWAAGYIEAACAHGVISGYANGNFY